MPSKAEIKKNSKPVKKASPEKKKILEGKSLKAKAVVKKDRSISKKATASGGEKKTVTKKVERTLKNRIIVSKVLPTIEQITARAHQLWVEEGYPEGRAEIHWHQAESELLGR